jgi:type VI secretion system secreted protein VgrG
MLASLRPFFDHSRHKLQVRNLDAALDVLAFEGKEALSRPFAYHIEFTSGERDLPADRLLGQDAHFSLHPPPCPLPFAALSLPPVQPLRTLHGVVTGFRRLSGSNDEARYEITLQPRLALLGRGRQYRIYQHLSVPEIVEKILRSERHRWAGQDFFFDLKREYPKREQVMQYAESDLAFIDRLLAEAGIWYRFTADERLSIDVVEFHDDQRNYQFGVQLPCRPPSGISASGQDAVWHLQSGHGVVERGIHVRAYDPRNAVAYLDGDVGQSRGDPTAYGEAYHYAEHYTELGDAFAQDEDLQSESGYFYARLRHERYLNARTQLGGTTSSALLAPGQVLKIDGGAPQAFAPGAVITQLTTRAARDRSFEASFQAIPYAEHICFRPELKKRPQIAGTLPARITSPQPDDTYGHIDLEGRYKVNFLFDRDSWPAGEESMWLRLARPYAGDTHGLHLPLIQGTEVAIAFERGDPDKGFIAFALHDSRHPDHVTLKNYKRNVLRTPANNKLRLDDTRGQEHIKLSTEHSGKSQLNLGHLVDSQRQKRGEGFELRTDNWGALRAGKGLFISTDEQTRAGGQVLDMVPAVTQLENAAQQLRRWQEIAQAHHSRESSADGLHDLLQQGKQLQGPAILLSAPRGIAAVTPASLLLHSNQSLYVQSQDEINLAAAQRLAVQANQAISLLAQQEGMRLVSGKGPLEIESHGDVLNLIAQQDITVQSVQGHLQLTAKNGITLGCGGGYIRITPSGAIDIHSPGKLHSKGQHVWDDPAGQSFFLPELPTSVCEDCLKKAQAQAAGAVMRLAN